MFLGFLLALQGGPLINVFLRVYFDVCFFWVSIQFLHALQGGPLINVFLRVYFKLCFVFCQFWLVIGIIGGIPDKRISRDLLCALVFYVLGFFTYYRGAQHIPISSNSTRFFPKIQMLTNQSMYKIKQITFNLKRKKRKGKLELFVDRLMIFLLPIENSNYKKYNKT